MEKLGTKIQKKRSIIESHEGNKYDNIFLFLFGLLISIPLLFRGLHFEKELLPILIGIYLMFIFWAVSNLKNRNFKIMSSSIDYLVLGIVLMYLISIAYGVNKRESIIEFSRYMGYFIIFLMVQNLSKKEKIEKIILNIVLVGGLVVSTIGIGTAIGTWEYNGAMLSGRISSTFQYPNTLASYVSALYFIAMSNIINEDKKILKSLYGGVAGIFIFSLILTYSRGMWLIFPVLLLLYFISSPNNRKLEVILYMFASAIISIPASLIFAKGLEEPSPKLWGIYILLAIGTGILIFLVSFLDKRMRQISIKKLVIALGILAILLSLGLVYIANSTTELVLENNTTEDRWTTIIRNISNTLPGANYKLQIDYIGEKQEETPFMGRIVIYNISAKGELTNIGTHNIVELEDDLVEIPFTTEEDSIGIKVYFQNFYKGSSVTFKKAIIIDDHNSEQIKTIPLKYKYLTEGIVNRIQSINIDDNSASARIIFSKDGLKIVKDYPILGTGGGGWKTLYQKYQSYPYWSTLAHNFVLQLWIEIGTIGLLLFIFMILILTISSYKTFKKFEKIEDKVLIVGLYTSIIGMIMHGIIDFDMSLPAYTFIFWTFMGILTNKLVFEGKIIEKFIDKLNKINLKVFVYPLILIAIILVINNSMLIYSGTFVKKAFEANDVNDIDTMITNLTKAIKYDRYEPTYKMDLANAYLKHYEGTEDIEYARKAVDLVEEYEKLEKFSSEGNAYASRFYLSIGQIDKGIELLERSVELQPMRTENYIQKIDGYRAVMNFYFSQGENEKAIDSLKQALSVKDDIKKVNEIALKPLTINNDLVQLIGETQYLYENMDNLQDLADRGLVIDFAYYFDVDINNDGNMDMLYSSIPEGSKIEHQPMTESEENLIRITNEGEVYGFKYVYPLNLEPNTTYVVELKARGTTKPETFNLYAWSNGAADPNQGSLLGIGLTNDWQTYSFEFTTDSDVEPGKQYIRIQHNGNDMGYIDIKDLVIFTK